MLELEVLIDGAPRRLDAEALADLEPLEVPGDSGKGARDAWSVRAVVRELAGEGARLTRVRSHDGEALEVAPEAWAAPERVPLLRLNRRGRLKFHWAGRDLAPADGDVLRDVAVLEIATRAT